MDQTKLEVFEFDSGVEGPKLLITACIHGNEKCGEIASSRWMDRLKSGEFLLKKGCVRFIPICNPRAYEEDIRFIDVNLNRVIRDHETPVLYEHFLARQIYRQLEWATHVLDIHSYTADDIPFAFCEKETKEVLDFVSMIDVPYIMVGLDNLLRELDLLDAYNSVENVGIAMNKIASTVECGQNQSSTSPEVADRTIGSVMSGLGMISGYEITQEPKAFFRATDIVYKKEEGRLSKKWGNFEPVEKGDVIARYDSGQEFKAKADGVIFLPRDKEVGSEWYHMAVAIDKIS